LQAFLPNILLSSKQALFIIKSSGDPASYESVSYCEYNPEHIALFSDGTHKAAQKPLRSNILAAISDMSTHATEDDSILFFFAGHGTRDTKDSYLLTQEFRTAIVAETSIPMNTINEQFHTSDARYRMRFFDACHSGRAGVRGTPPHPDIKKHFLVEGEGWTTLSACKEDQYAHEDVELGHGIFSYCLVKGLSGDAVTAEQEVTLDSLAMYTITKTSEITKERGLPQTPVFDSYHTGALVLATVRAPSPTQIPLALVKVQETAINQLKPSPEKIPQLVADIRSVLQNQPEQQDYIAPSQEEKFAFGNGLVQKIHYWCQEQEGQYRKQLQGVATISVKRLAIQTCPLNLQLAKYIQNSPIKQAVELTLKYRTETVASKSWLTIIPSYSTHEVLDGISEVGGYYESSVMLTIRTQEQLLPVCGIVIAIIPATFGLYLLRYTCSTQLGPGQKEHWDPNTLSVRTLHALPFTDKEGIQALKELQDLFPQLVSFFSESCMARKTYMQSIGASGQSLL